MKHVKPRANRRKNILILKGVYMNPLEVILSFITVMTIIIAPCVVINRRKPKRNNERMDKLEQKVNELEVKLLEGNNEVHSLKNDINFMQRILEDKSREN
jgi:peptidoglycan hydrolase CwlO-like protein